MKIYWKDCDLREAQIVKYIALHHLISHHFNFLLICFALRNRIFSSLEMNFFHGYTLHNILSLLFFNEQPCNVVLKEKLPHYHSFSLPTSCYSRGSWKKLLRFWSHRAQHNLYLIKTCLLQLSFSPIYLHIVKLLITKNSSTLLFKNRILYKDMNSSTNQIWIF